MEEQDVVVAVITVALLVLALGSVSALRYHPPPEMVNANPRAPRGVKEGVSSKELLTSTPAEPFGWSNNQLQWQRTAYHFQPEKNWMNDPNGPLYYNGWYHLFYQCNPDSAVWGNITWGHSASRDLINWIHLPVALRPDRWYDENGAWTGSATILPTGDLVILYTGSTDGNVQVQNLAVPADPEDPLLIHWVKSDSNPILFPPKAKGIQDDDFRDPTTAWYDSADSTWRIAIGSKNANTGLTLLYKTKDFVNYQLLPEVLHAVPGTGMWECVDFFPVSKDSESGLDTSENGPHVRHVLKASLDDDRYDYYAIGTYDAGRGIWTPDDPEVDVGIGAKYDYGKFYAAKTFFDPKKNRRVLWGWTGETDSEKVDVLKGWASIMAFPRTLVLDRKTGTNLLQWPVEEVEKLRTDNHNFSDINISAGSVIPLDVGTADQLDITVEFELPKKAFDAVAMADSNTLRYNCSTSSGATGRGVLGPFGVLVLADQNRTEQTAVYFYIAKSNEGKFQTFFCQDEIMSSQANGIIKQLPGIIVPVLNGENLSVRILVDHSIVESFAQGGRTCITSRVYPTQAINATHIFLFNNATNENVIAKSVNVWKLKSAFLLPYTTFTGKTTSGWNDLATS